MTLNKRKLRKMCESMRVQITQEQENAILERFGTDPIPYEWSEQDIGVQLKNFLGCGKFEKPIRGNDGLPVFVLDDDF